MPNNSIVRRIKSSSRTLDDLREVGGLVTKWSKIDLAR